MCESEVTDEGYIKLNNEIIGHIETNKNTLLDIEINKNHRRNGHAENAIREWMKEKEGEYDCLQTTTVVSHEMGKLLRKLGFEKMNEGEGHYIYYY